MTLTRRTLLQSAAATAAASAVKAAPNDRITIGMIGTGARGHELMQAIQQHSSTEIVGVVDAYKGRVERALDRTAGRAKAYADHHELLAQKSIDTVVVATPDHLHHPIIMEALAHNKDVYSEKPLTYRAGEGVEIIASAKNKGRILQVGSQGASSDVQRKAKDIIRSGKLGRVTMVRAAYNRNTASGAWIYPIPPDASPQTVNWEMFLGPAPKRPFSLERFFRWRCYEDYSGGIATDLFVHLCTTIHFVMDARMPSSVVGMGQLYRWKQSREVHDTINAILEYPEGFVVNLSSTFNNQASAEASFSFHGTEGTLTIGWNDVTYYPENTVEDNRWIVESWPKALELAYWKDPKVIEAELRKPPAKEPEVYRGQGPEATVLHFGNFFGSVRSRQPVWEDAAVGHHAAACAHMVNLSAKHKRVVQWDFEKDSIKT